MAVWSTSEVEYLCAHAGDGAASVAHALNRSVQAVKIQAHRYGISLRKRWHCPRCGNTTFTPLSPKSGWCSACSKEEQAIETARQIALMERDACRDLEATRARQAVYSEKSKRKSRILAD